MEGEMLGCYPWPSLLQSRSSAAVKLRTMAAAIIRRPPARVCPVRRSPIAVVRGTRVETQESVLTVSHITVERHELM